MLHYLAFCVLVGVSVYAQHDHGHHHGSHQDRLCYDGGLHLNCSSYGSKLECGTNNVTYANRCYFIRDHCTNDDLHIAHSGKCDAPTDNQGTTGQQAQWMFFCTHLAGEKCDVALDEVCATNGVTYDNLCEFEKGLCMHAGLKIASYGKCASASS